MIADVPHWRAVPFALSYRVGEVTVFRKRLRALALQAHFFTLPDDPGVPPPPVERFKSDVDVIVTRSHPVREELPTVAVVDGVLRYVTARYSRFHTDLSGSFDEYLARFSSKSRSTLRRKVRKLVEHADGVTMRTYARPEEMSEFLQRAGSVSALTYQHRLLDAGLPTDAAYLSKLERLAANDSVRGYVLFLGEAPIAYLCCPAVDGVLMYGYLGYDPKYSEMSPGTVLQYLAFESIFREHRFRAFDFTDGQGEHKRFFGTHETRCADICYFPDSYRARLWVRLHRWFDRASTGLVRSADRLGVKAKLKRLVRTARIPWSAT